MSTPTDELRAAATRLRAAATRLRDDRDLKGRVDSGSRELLEMIRVLLTAREPLIRWLEDAATIHLPESECGYCYGARNPLKLPCPALAVARAINGASDPGPGQDGHITDMHSGSYLLEHLRRAAGETR